MRYFVVSDIHSYYEPLKKALDEAGYDPVNADHTLIVLGDVFDRGPDTIKVYDFLTKTVPAERLVLIRGNHERLMMEMNRRGYPETYDYTNGTVESVLQITGCSLTMFTYDMATTFSKLTSSKPFIWIKYGPWVDYYEMQNYIFVHGWLPLKDGSNKFSSYKPIVDPNWRMASGRQWDDASWMSGVEALERGCVIPGKTIVCGHWHTSAFHSAFEKRVADEFGEDADFSIFRSADGSCIAIDACTAWTNKTNVLVIDDDDEGRKQ